LLLVKAVAALLLAGLPELAAVIVHVVDCLLEGRGALLEILEHGRDLVYLVVRDVPTFRQLQDHAARVVRGLDCLGYVLQFLDGLGSLFGATLPAEAPERALRLFLLAFLSSNGAGLSPKGLMA
jgi:hypothetical protein